MYLLLHRALANAGDYLIFERAVRLVQKFRPNAQLVFGDASRPLQAQFGGEALGQMGAVVVCGGPGYQRHMYPQVYPLIEPERISAPIVFLALGSYLFPGSPAQINAFEFDDSSRRFLKHITEQSLNLGARDYLTVRVLAAAGLHAVTMTGDPAWYDLEQLDESVRQYRVPPRSIAFTPPAARLFELQGIRMMRGLRDSYPSARRVVVFHRGVQSAFLAEAERGGWTVLDITGSSHGLGIYDEVDIHVGYRLHAHLYALSHGRISYLIAEDSRGIGTLDVLGPLGVDPLTGSKLQAMLRMLRRGASSIPWAKQVAGLAVGDVHESVLEQIEVDASRGFERHILARRRILDTFPAMRSMIESLP